MNKKSILWKLYFWFIFLGYLLGVGLLFFTEEKIISRSLFSELYDVFFIIIGMISILGIRGYIYEKRYFSRDIWIFFFFLLIVDFIGNFIFELNTILVQNIFDIGISIIIILILIPWYFALYKYSFKMNEVWSVSND